MAAYKFLDKVDKNKIFITSKSEIEGRIDPIYFKAINDLQIVKNTQFPVLKLSEVANMQRGRFGHRPRNDLKFFNGKYPFIQTGDVVKASVNGGQIPFSQTLNELGLKTSRIFNNKTIVITIAANIGDTAILDYPACFPDSLIAITPKNEDILFLEYLNIYFKFLKNYLNNLAPQAAQKNINYQQLSPTPIIIPPIEIQQEIINLYNKAYQTKQQKEQQAKELLNSIDTYLLNELGITLPKKDNSLKSRMFQVNYSEVSGQRFESEFYTQYNRDIIKAINLSKYAKESIKKECEFVPGYAFKSKDYVKKSECYLITIKNIYKNTIRLKKATYLPSKFYDEYSRFKITRNDLLIAMTGATIGKVGIYNSDNKALLNQRNGLIKSKNIDTYYLMNLLNTNIYQTIILRNSVGGAQPNISETDITKIKIPVPPLEKQKEIADHIRAIRTEAKKLQLEADTILENAKQEVEQLILGK